MVCARSILAALNDLGRAPVRGDLALSLRARRPEGRIARRPARPLDAASERELAAVMVYLRPPLASGELVRDYVAGYQFHGGIELEPQMAVGDELELARELENPHDGLAVAIRWRCLRIGYVPRVINAVIARRLDVGDHRACQLIRLDDQADPWERVAFTIRQVRACPSWAA